MAQELFDVNFRDEFGEAFAGLLAPLVLVKISRASSRPHTRPDPLAPAPPQENRYPAEGVLDVEIRTLDDTLIPNEQTVIGILGKSLPDGIVPEANDRIEIDGGIYVVSRVGRDVTQAWFECAAEEHRAS